MPVLETTVGDSAALYLPKLYTHFWNCSGTNFVGTTVGVKVHYGHLYVVLCVAKG